MNKYNFLATCMMLLWASVSLTAQEDGKTSSARIGVKGGFNLSNLYVQDSEKSELLAGFNGGLFAKLTIDKGIAIQPEIYYTTKGAVNTYNNGFVNGSARFNLNYIEIPLLVVINVTDNFNFHLGPCVSYLLSGKVKNESNVNAFNFENNINSDDYNRFDGGMCAGVGIDVGAFSLGARYTYGFSKVGKQRDFLGTQYRFPDAVNQVLNFYVGLSLN